MRYVEGGQGDARWQADELSLGLELFFKVAGSQGLTERLEKLPMQRHPALGQKKDLQLLSPQEGSCTRDTYLRCEASKLEGGQKKEYSPTPKGRTLPCVDTFTVKVMGTGKSGCLQLTVLVAIGANDTILCAELENGLPRLSPQACNLASSGGDLRGREVVSAYQLEEAERKRLVPLMILKELVENVVNIAKSIVAHCTTLRAHSKHVQCLAENVTH